MRKTLAFVIKLLFCHLNFFTPEQALELNLSLRNLDADLTMLQRVIEKEHGFLLGPWLVDKKMGDILSADQLHEANVSGKQKIIIAYDREKNIYQLYGLRQQFNDCSIYAFRNILYMLSFFNVPQDHFSFIYSKMLSQVNADGIALNRYTPFSLSKLTRLIKENRLPCLLPQNDCLPADSYDTVDKIIDIDANTWITSLAPTQGVVQSNYAKIGLPAIATLESLQIDSNELKQFIGDAVSLSDLNDLSVTLINNFFKQRDFTFGINLTTYTCMEHGVGCIVHKYNGNTEYIFCDSFNSLFPTAWGKNFQYALDSIVRWTRSLSYFNDCLVRKIYIKTVYFTEVFLALKEQIPLDFKMIGYDMLAGYNLFSHDLYRRVYKNAFIKKLQQFKLLYPEQNDSYNQLITLFQDS